MRTETLHAAFINSSPCSVEWAATAYIGNEWQWCRYPVNTKQERIFLMYHSYCISFHHMKTNISNILTGTLFIQSQLMYCTVLLLCAVFDFDLWSLAVFSSCSFKPGKMFSLSVEKMQYMFGVCFQWAFYALWDGTFLIRSASILKTDCINLQAF